MGQSLIKRLTAYEQIISYEKKQVKQIDDPKEQKHDKIERMYWIDRKSVV